jgi:hypothetical protein
MAHSWRHVSRNWIGVGVIIFNEGNPGRTELFGGTLGGPVVTIPVLSASFALGTELNDLIGNGLMLHMVTDVFTELRTLLSTK